MSAGVRAQNPYLEEYKRLNKYPEETDYLDYVDGPTITALILARETLVKSYSWAIPNQPALDALASVGPIVEMGAGTGYWASLLRAMGVDIVAYDVEPPGNGHITRNKWHVPQQYTDVVSGNPEVLWAHGDRALFLCWPPYSDPMAADCLRMWQGETLVFVGESSGGCTADNAFFELLTTSFERKKTVQIPTWYGVRDYMTVWKRQDPRSLGPFWEPDEGDVF